MAPRGHATLADPPAELRAGRDRLCRLLPELHLQTLDEAVEFLTDRAMLTVLPDSALPSLFGACDPPDDPEARGFARWPADKWWWDMALVQRPGVYRLRIHRGKGLFVSDALLPVLEPLCSADLAHAEGGGYGPEAAAVTAHLRAAGVSLVEDVKEELGLAPKTLRGLRDRLERRGAVVSREVRVAAKSGGHRHTSELALWDQVYPGGEDRSGPVGLPGLVAAGVRAAVLAPEQEVQSWFSWPVDATLVDELVEAGRLMRPAPGWLAVSG
jgi:hypothetical protein